MVGSFDYGFQPDVSPWQIGARAKRSSPAAGDLLRSRAIVFDDAGSALISSMLSQPFGDMLKVTPGPVKIGHRNAQGGASADADVSAAHAVELEIDHKRFGFRLAEPLLVDAFGLIRACLPPGPKFDNWVRREMSHVIIKTLVLPGGWVYKWTFGNPSGPWTSILDSLCNWLATSGAMLEHGLHPKNSTLWVYGDDTLIFIKSLNDYVPATTIQATLSDTYGILAGESNVGHFDAYGDESGTTFLGCWMRDGLFGRPLDKWLDVSVLPERSRLSVASQYARMSYLPVSAVCTSSNEAYFTSYFEFVRSRLPEDHTFATGSAAQEVRNLTDAAHNVFSDGGSDVREWEAGAKATVGPLREGGRYASVDELDGQTIAYSLSWLARPPRGGRRLPASAGFTPKQAQRAYSRVRCGG